MFLRWYTILSMFSRCRACSLTTRLCEDMSSLNLGWEYGVTWWGLVKSGCIGVSMICKHLCADSLFLQEADEDSVAVVLYKKDWWAFLYCRAASLIWKWSSASYLTCSPNSSSSSAPIVIRQLFRGWLWWTVWTIRVRSHQVDLGGEDHVIDFD